MHINDEPSKGSYAARVTAQPRWHIIHGCTDLAPAGLSTGCCAAIGATELQEVSAQSVQGLAPCSLCLHGKFTPCALEGMRKGRGLGLLPS